MFQGGAFRISTRVRKVAYEDEERGPGEDAVTRGGWPHIIPAAKCPLCSARFMIGQSLEMAGCGCVYHSACLKIKRTDKTVTNFCEACRRDIFQFQLSGFIKKKKEEK